MPARPSKLSAFLDSQYSRTLCSPSSSATAAVDAYDAGLFLECAEHKHYSAVLAQMGDCLHASAGPVEVRDAAWVEHGELTVVGLRRAVHEPVARNGRGRDEKDGL